MLRLPISNAIINTKTTITATELVEVLAELVVVVVAVAVWVEVMFPQLTVTVLMVIFVKFVEFALTT